MDGILNVFKPAGMSSASLILNLRIISGEDKAGHAGTLDPNAMGVLPVCFGKATRLIEYMDRSHKSYRCEALLGRATDTQDIWGNVVSEKEVCVSRRQVEEALATFQGDITQIPPAYSAVWVDGRRMYSYARSGVDVKLEGRPINISKIELLDFSEGRVLFDVSCSRGTYVRTICHDLGEKLGCGACMSFLLRTSACSFELKDSVSLEELAALSKEEIGARLLPMESAVSDLESFSITPAQAVYFMNGDERFFRGCFFRQKPDRIYAVYCEGRLLGIARSDEKRRVKPYKVLK